MSKKINILCWRLKKKFSVYDRVKRFLKKFKIKFFDDFYKNK